MLTIISHPGVRLTACVDYAKKPDKPFNLKFTPSAGTCMRETGSRGEVLVKDKGLACAHLGYVEASDLLFYGKCKGNNRFLSLSFDEDDKTRGEYVFQFEAHTLRPDKVEVENEVTGFDVGICEEPKLCTKKHRHFRDMEDWWVS